MDIYSPERNTQLIAIYYIKEKPYLFRISVDVTPDTNGQPRYSARLLQGFWTNKMLKVISFFIYFYYKVISF
jgi:hypothetical protein